MFFMLSVPSPAARTSLRNIAAMPSAPSAITATTMTSTRLEPPSCTVSGMSPVMILLGVVRRTQTAPDSTQVVALARPRGETGQTADCSGVEGLGLGVVDREHLGQAGDPEDLQQPVLAADQLHRAVLGTHLLQAADQDAQARGV